MHECVLCGYIYDEETEGVSFAELGDDFHCPFCSAGKAAFRPLSGAGSG